MWKFLKTAEIPLRVAAVIALVYLGYVFLSHYQSDRQWNHRHQPAAATVDPEKQAKFDAIYGGEAVKILGFYARDGVLTEGEETVLCYSVLNAKSLAIEPAVEGVVPALNHCVSVQPDHDTKYTLTATGKDGKTASAAFTLTVQPDPDNIPHITAFQVVKHSQDAGKHYFTIAFRFQNARKVSIDPPVFSPLEDSAPFGQFIVAPETSTTYTLTVTGKKGRTDKKKLTVEVPKG